MKEKIQKDQIKTYKDIIIENIDNKDFYKVDEKKQKELLKKEKIIKENKKILVKVLIFFVFMSIMYFVLTRYVFKFKKDPVYFSNIFIQKVQSDKNFSLKIINKDAQLNINYLKSFFKKLNNNEGYLNSVYLTELVNGNKKNIKASDFLKHIDSTFDIGKINSFNKNFVVSDYILDGKKYYFAFFDVYNYSIANKYMIIWEDLFKKKYSKEFKGFISKTINNKKARVLIDYNDNEILGYSFVDDKTLVFFDNSEAFDKVVNRIVISSR